MGGYGVNLKKRHIGYGISGRDGIRQVLDLRQIDVPIIISKDDFRQFIEKTPYGVSAIALICPDNLFRGQHQKPLDNSFYAIKYERRVELDTLYFYGYCIYNINVIMSYFKNTRFRLYSTLDTSDFIGSAGLFAIEDANTLYQQRRELEKDPVARCARPDSPIFSEVSSCYFERCGPFKYDEKQLMAQHFQMMTSIQNSLPRPVLQPSAV